VIHPTADVSVDARIGARTRIWGWAQVREHAVVGDDCVIGSGVYVDRGVHIGDRVKVQSGALIYHGSTVEDGVFIGPGAILTNDRQPRATTRSGHLASDSDWTVDPIVLAEGCSLGAGVIVVAGCRVGRAAMIGAGSIVTRDVPDHALIVGSPGRRIGWVCACGRRLHGPDGRPARGDHEGRAVCVADGSEYTIADDRCVALSTSDGAA
jgi:UDP-2-acetamido-3-amino-2,3-dideoxy-glucuronate N-acetyltransferase